MQDFEQLLLIHKRRRGCKARASRNYVTVCSD